MSEATVRIVLRLVAVITILVGTIFLGMSLVAYVGASRAIHGATEGLGSNLTSMTLDFTWYGLLAQAVIAGEGILLYFLSPMLARKMVE
jgi:hypothetical protein